MLLFNPSDSAGQFLAKLFRSCISGFCLGSRIGESTRFYDWMKVNLINHDWFDAPMLFYFKRVSLVAPVANVIAVPSVTVLILPGCLLSLFVSLFSLSWVLCVFAGLVSAILYCGKF